MPELRELRRKLDSLDGLREIVNAMRNLAAAYVRRAESALEGTRPYTEVVETALQAAFSGPGMRAPGPLAGARSLAVLFASDQGLCGAYNERAVRSIASFHAEADGNAAVAVVGLRAQALLRLKGIEAMLARSAPASLEAIGSQVPELAADLFEAYEQCGAERMVFVYNAYEGMGRFRETVRCVLPPSPAEIGEGRTDVLRHDPLLTMPHGDLLGNLIEEYFFIQLYRALLEAHASENGARLISMTSAAGSIDDRFQELTREFQVVRQDAITAELLDIVAGAEAQC